MSENYDQIARDHLAASHQGVSNPFIQEELWQVLESSTLRLIKKYAGPGSTILDVGVGLGRLLGQVQESRRFGADITFKYLEAAKERGIEVCCAEADDLPYQEAMFDLVVCTDVLEHVLDLNGALKSILRVLKPGGVLLIRVPDREDLSPYLASDYPYHYAHLRNFDEAGLRLLISRVFECEFLETSYVHICYDVKMKMPLPSVIKHVATKILKGVLQRAKTISPSVTRWIYNPLEINMTFRKADKN
ncbi:MAG TPA: class I SAM-dependent methyltransferase [Nitrospira sp.]|nr:class I SAM-dependent methyltransferase [Nitrospira sp.]